MTKLERTFWVSAVCIAVGAGLFFRFTGFYKWPLSVDEYYIYRSMAFVLESGLPQFPCGGYYPRGLLYQYLVAPLLLVGISPEAALRGVSIICNILMLPAAYLLARSIGGVRIAAAVLIVLAFSTWEIEMSRFGRMYAPFQMIFMWYVYHAYKLVSQHDLTRWRWLLALSIVGPLLWEGAIVLTLFNFVLILVEPKCRSAKHISGAMLIFLSTAGFLGTNFRFRGVQSPPVSSDPATTLSSVDRVVSYVQSITPMIADSPVSLVTFLILALSLVIFVSRALLRSTFSATEKIVLVISSITLMANQLVLTALVLAGAGLVDWIRPETIRKREFQYVAMTMLAVCVFFAVFAVLGDYAPTLTSRLRVLIAFPDILYTTVYPWLFAIPVMAIALVFLTVLASWYCLTRQDSTSRGTKLLIAFALLSIAVVGVIPTQYHEIRYSFFLYPLLICISGYAIENVSRHLQGWHRALPTLIPASFVAIFFVSSDFAFDHLVKIDSHDANYRIGYSIHRARQYYPRMDFRGPAEYVNEYADEADSIIVSSVVYSQYLDNPGSVYLDKSDGRYSGQACPNSPIERWTNLPLLNSTSDLAAAIGLDDSQTTWIIVDQQTSTTQRWDKFLENNSSGKEVFKSTDDRTSVYMYSSTD